MIRYLLPLFSSFFLLCSASAQPTFPSATELTVSYHLRPQQATPPGDEYTKYYSSWRDLATRSQSETAWIRLSLKLDSTVRQTDWASLGQVRRVRRLSLSLGTPLTQPLADSLLAAMAQWPDLIDLSVSGSNNRSATKPVSIFIDGRGSARLKTLTVCTFTPVGGQMGAVLQLISHAPALTQLTILNYGGTSHALPAELGQIRTLTQLFLNGTFSFSDLEQSLPILPNLTTLWLQQSGTGRQLTHLLGRLPNLRHLSLGLHQAKADSLGGLRLGGLMKLDTLTINGNYSQRTPLDSALAGLTTLKRVSINNATFSSLDWLADNPALRSVELSSCRFAPTGRSLAGLTYLNQFTIQQNDSLRQFPNLLTMAPNLRELTIRDTRIGTLPPSIGALTSLTALNLWRNKLTSLPAEIGKLKALKSLSLGDNQLTALPAEIKQLDQLTSLEVTNNRLTELPESIGQLRQLTSLVASRNKLVGVPDALGQCRQLKRLALDNNPMTSLPETIGNLDSLSSIELTNTRLVALPASVGRWKKLRSFWLSGSRLTSLPVGISNWQQLEWFSLTDSTLAQLPASIGNWSRLYSINLGLPQLQQLPAEFVKLTALTDAHLSLPQLLALPDELGTLSRLGQLNLTSRRLRGLPNSIGRLTKLRSLRINGGMDPAEIDKPAGQLLQLPDSLVRCQNLTDLDIQNQLAFDGNDAIQKATRLPKLTNLGLNRCGMDRLTDIDWKMVSLRSLSLERNSLRDVPEAILDAPKLESVNLAYNFPLPRPLKQAFWGKEQLRLAFAEQKLTTTPPPTDKPNATYMRAYLQSAYRQMQQRNWGEAFADADKAVLVAPDTLKAMPLAQRAGMRFFRKEFAASVSDFEQAIRLSNRLATRSLDPSRPMPFDRKPMVAQWWGQMGSARLALGQFDGAIRDLDSALVLLGKDDDILQRAPRTHFYIEQGKAWANLNKPDNARRTLTAALALYASTSMGIMPMTSPGDVLTEVELAILTNQLAKATEALTRFRRGYVREGRPPLSGGYLLLAEYLTACVAVLTGTQTPEQARTALTTYLKTNPDKIRGWSFELFETTLPRLGFPADKITALLSLTALAKEQVAKME